ncbi:MAG: DUF2948 family protein [Alphaproteobacteria bacterium]|jgi:hypothetical protein|uniref:DUF2948 family protein n=1 Tax=Loktanella salsilacus TaxID=195913 RepID=UPI001EBBDCF3|nr:DUF2948 family protein [Alphaproteobacteria bacterium]MBU0861866.1 DUF2948 family protein [Alphaproteobacteria bacterium]|tara:strand:- start:2093 stop:2569 length:477 start_codon:yes stop_codon:yes gene_type:complete
MTEDARFEDGGDKPLALMARDAEDLQVISALAQDAVFPASEMRWTPADRRFAILLNRFRWEDAAKAHGRRDFERVQSVLLIEDVMGVRSQGVPKGDADTILSLLALEFRPGPDGTGEVVMTLAGDGVISCAVEALEVVLRDVTRPYIAPSRKAPRHPD